MVKSVTVGGESLVFHMPGKHPQKRHGYRMKSGTKSVRSKSGEWKPVKYEKGRKTEHASPNPEKNKPPKPQGGAAAKRAALEDIAKKYPDNSAELAAAEAAVKAATDEYWAAPYLSRTPESIAQTEAARQKMKAARAHRDKVKNSGIGSDAAKAEMRAALKADQPMGKPPLHMITLQYAPKNGKPNAAMNEGADFIGEIIDRRALVSPAYANGTPSTAIMVKKNVRASANSRRIRLAPDDGPAVMVHEYGHMLEHRDRALADRSTAWRDKRTEGERNQRLKDVTGIQSYKDDEVTKPDKFIDAYVGKDYGPGASEVLSMGLEALYTDPLKFARDDPDHFDFTLNAVQPQGPSQASEDPYEFHLPGKHAQKRHGYRMKGDVKSVKDRKGEWKPVKYDKGAKTPFASPNPEKNKPPKPAGADGPAKRAALETVAKKYGEPDEAGAAALDAEIKAIRDQIWDPTVRRDRAELDGMYAEMNAKKAQATALRNSGYKSKEAIAEMRTLLHASDPIGAPGIQMLTNKWTVKNGKPNARMTEGADFVGAVVSKKTLGRDSLPVQGVTTRKNARAYHLQGKILLDPLDSATVFVHEYGHVLEHGNPAITQRSIDWRNKRTEGERSVSMRKATGNPLYRADESTKPDKFRHPYIGKDYGNRASEVLSMGMQFLHEDPLGFARDDPDHFDFTIQQIQGEGGP